MAEVGNKKISAYQDIKNASLYEPRICYIKRTLENILPLVVLEWEGKGVKVDGFRLKNLRDWLVPSSGDPIEIFGYAGSRCNISCAFCYNSGNPPSLALGNLQRPPEEECHDVMTRLKYFNPRAGFALYPALGDTYEVLAHPYVLDVLYALRQVTDRPFRIGTNGAALTEQLLKKLGNLKPIYFYLNVNSVGEGNGQKIMRDGTFRISTLQLLALKDAGIPYALTLVPWPVQYSLEQVLESMAASVELAHQCHAHLIEVNLPGYTRHFSRRNLFDLEEVWSAVVAHVRELREKFCTPIVAMPSMYEENLYEKTKNLPSVIGTVRNSPAENAGIKRGDVIEKIGQIAVANRPQVRDLLTMVRNSGAATISLAVNRGGSEVPILIDTGHHCYPYSPEIDQHLGIITLGTGLRPSYLEGLRELMDRRGAKKVLLLSSALVRPLFQQLLTESPLFSGPEVSLDIEVPANKFFGGNIFMGDLLVVQDFIDAIKDYLRRDRGRPDLVVIPSSPFNLGAWKRDLTGRCYLDIERAVDIPVELLECRTIYD